MSSFIFFNLIDARINLKEEEQSAEDVPDSRQGQTTFEASQSHILPKVDSCLFPVGQYAVDAPAGHQLSKRGLVEARLFGLRVREDAVFGSPPAGAAENLTGAPPEG